MTRFVKDVCECKVIVDGPFVLPLRGRGQVELDSRRSLASARATFWRLLAGKDPRECISASMCLRCSGLEAKRADF